MKKILNYFQNNWEIENKQLRIKCRFLLKIDFVLFVVIQKPIFENMRSGRATSLYIFFIKTLHENKYLLYPH